MLEISQLSYSIKGKTLIDTISQTFSKGVLYGILGPNGSGKTTLLKTMTGIWQPTQGKVFWNGQELLQQRRKEISKTISLVLQNHAGEFDFLVEEIVSMGRYPHGMSSKKELIDWALQEVDALELKNRPITCLSNGERQCAYIARALVTESPILLLDEPTASLDIRHQLKIWNLLKKLVEKGKIVIATIHDLSIAERFCDHIIILHRGSAIASGQFSQILNPSRLKEVFGVASSLDKKFYEII